MNKEFKRQFIVVLSLMLAINLTACSKVAADRQQYSKASTSGADIVGGQISDYRSAVASSIIFISTENQQGYSEICTGTFISNKYILTAAHCIAKDKEGMSLTFRNYKFSKTQNILNLPILETYKLNFKNINSQRHDLALIKYSGGLPFGAKIALLPNQIQIKTQLSYKNSLSFLAIGYGKNTGHTSDDNLFTGEGVLRQKIMQSNLIKPTSDLFRIDQQKNKGGVCFGDSGSPALIKNKKTDLMTIIGVASAVDTSRIKADLNIMDSCMNESIYLNMYFYSNLIKEFIRSNEQNKNSNQSSIVN